MKKLHNKYNCKYLLLPVAAGQPLKDIRIYMDKELAYEFRIPAAGGEECYEFQYYAPLSLENGGGREIEIDGDAGSAFLEAISFSDAIPWKADSHPAVHFSANTGWLNDPNGFFYRDGVYHLYFQHNPFDTLWGNMSWGHAVSTDLLHWEQRDTVLYPDGDGTIFSGCALVDENGRLTFFYTSAGNTSAWSRDKKFTQKLAWSEDGGESVTKTDIVAVPHIAGGNRDPKVYWHGESQGYYMVLYLEKNEFAILRSTDLVDWKLTQRLELEDAWECPDLFQVPVESGTSRWVFWCADGFYFLGDFDGYSFTRTSEKMQAYASALPYAAQTCWGADRVISIPWLRSGNPGRTYTGVMGIPRELSLAEQNGTLRIRQRPIRELAGCRQEIEGSLREDMVFYTAKAGSAVELTIALGDEKDFSVSLNGVKIRCDSGNKSLEVTGCRRQEGEEKWRRAEKTQIDGGCCKKEITLEKAPDRISILADQEILEITADDGMLCAVFEIECGQEREQTQAVVKTLGKINFYEIR